MSGKSEIQEKSVAEEGILPLWERQRRIPW
jgi:hypothetical protein